MAIDIKNLVQLIQKKEHAVTSSTSVQDMIDILKAAQKAEGSLIRNYDSAGDLPDAATTNERIAYLSDTRTLRFNNGTWDNPLLGAAAAAGYTFQGSTSGYTTGGNPGTNVGVDIIEKYSFTADGNSTDVGDLINYKYQMAGQSSTVSGYTSGGTEAPVGLANSTTIEKFSFSTDGNATDVGDLTAGVQRNTGQSNSVSGYSSAGYSPASPQVYENRIEKFSFATDGNATDVGDLIDYKMYPAGQSSSDNGYVSGGQNASLLNVIEKFPFAVDANSADVGDLTQSPHSPSGQSSTESGYRTGGRLPAASNVIDKFPFASDANATDVGDMTVGRWGPSGTSSTTHGFAASGYTPNASNVIEKFPFSTDANATDVGDLTAGRLYTAGQQV